MRILLAKVLAVYSAYIFGVCLTIDLYFLLLIILFEKKTLYIGGLQ